MRRGEVVRHVDGFTLGYVQQVFANPVYREGLVNSLLIASCTTVLAVLLAMPLALAARGTRFRARG